ncbi:heme ABC transporter ATP-binding protein [Mucilaginibacter sp. Bleaf8]|uniref:heme ABC transporter ATP-binding protein n=1 Tax=Mucilaginibacter sp. Bleaf8 TaxID=2834430 RepID=UPI001BCF27EB|nr:heme ABC transporter ATP-binding protein [Mucilaginibacter sp. Bleaf8]MBS7564104.1 heme ABC transporter ATP-binding protein [Mucilaginibacter sp. Bleaf8]
MITVKQVGYQAGSKTILNDISFTANQGEVLAVIGANGAGKSTLLKLLCREIHPTEGRIMFNKRDLVNYMLKELAGMRSVLTQQHTVSLSFMVKELVMMGRYPHFDNQPSAHDVSIVEQAMQITGITHLMVRGYDTLSGGEQQRVQLARVLAQILDVPGAWLFLDEPTNGLDMLHQQQLLQQARQMADKGFGVICILHDINQAAAYADKILVLKNGTQLAYGTPAEVVSPELIREAFGVQVKLLQDEHYKYPVIITTGAIANTN